MKKAGFMDIFLFIIIAFIVVVVLVLFKFASSTINTEMLAQAANMQAQFSNTTNVTAIIENTIGKVDEAFNHFKWITIFFIFGFALSILISAFLVRTHPAYFIAYAMMVVIAIIISVYLSNSYETLSQTPVLASTFFSFTGANYIMLYLPLWVTVIGLLAGILMYISLDWGGIYR